MLFCVHVIWLGLGCTKVTYAEDRTYVRTSDAVNPASQAYTVVMSKQRRENMEIGSEKSRMVHSLDPLVFATTGGMGLEAINMFYKRLADQASEHSLQQDHGMV